MTRTVTELNLLIEARAADIRRLGLDSANIDRELYTIPSYTVAYGRRLQDLEHVRSELLGMCDRFERLQAELNEALNPELA